MTTPFKSNFVQLNMNTIEEVRKAYNLDKPGMMEQAIDTFYDWIQKQDHFVKKDFRREYLERLIISTKGSIERAKKRIDKVCTMRTMVPYLFEKCNAKIDFSNLYETFTILIMPEITDDFHTIVILKANAIKPLSTAKLLEAYKFCILLCEYLKLCNYPLGLHVIIDLREINILEAISKIDIVDLRNTLALCTDSFRIKSILVLSDSSMVNAFVDIMRQFLSAKIGERIVVCKTIESLHERLPKQKLPEDYKGGQKSLSTLFNDLIEELSRDECIKYLEEMRGACTNEKFRSTEKFNEEYFGMPGSFKALSVD